MSSPAKNKNLPSYSCEEIAKHNNESSIWIIIEDNVLDVTNFAHVHPGGLEEITRRAGKDVTNIFKSIHSRTAKNMVKKFIIGKVQK